MGNFTRMSTLHSLLHSRADGPLRFETADRALSDSERQRHQRAFSLLMLMGWAAVCDQIVRNHDQLTDINARNYAKFEEDSSVTSVLENIIHLVEPCQTQEELIDVVWKHASHVDMLEEKVDTLFDS